MGHVDQVTQTITLEAIHPRWRYQVKGRSRMVYITFTLIQDKTDCEYFNRMLLGFVIVHIINRQT